jgi:CPA2 family monovalent cation:H+ antiporter-2
MAWSMGWTWQEGLVFGLALSVASTVVLLRALEDRRLLDSRRGTIAVGWLVVEDLITVFALVMLPVLAELATGTGTGGAGQLLGELARTLLSVGAFVLVMLVVGRRVIPWALQKVASTGSRELFTLAVLAIALGVAFGAAVLFDVSYALGAFFAGILLNESELSGRAAEHSLPLRDAFAVLFFVAAGMLFDPAVLVERPGQVLATVLIVVFGKSVAAYALVRLFGDGRDTALTVAASLAQIGEFSFILAGLALSVGLLPEEGRDLVVAAALISIIVNPFLFTSLDRRRAQAREAADVPPGPALRPGGHAIVIGYGRVGRVVAEDLGGHGITLVVVDDDESLIHRAHAAGIPGVRGNALSDRVLAETHPESASVCVVAIPIALEAGEVLGKLRAMNPDLILVARAHRDGELDYLREQGADDAVMAERELAHALAERAVDALAGPTA